MAQRHGWEHLAHRLMSGEQRGASATALRSGLRAAESVYACAMNVRNRMYDRGTFQSHPLGRATISVGNVTAGGTGKTPFVRWLSSRLCQDGHRPAILLRGYKSADGFSDEAEMLRQQLSGVVVKCGADRVATAAIVLRDDPQISVFVLDDAFQHRRAARDLDIVLINAVQPFGYGHVHPRGLLREPLDGLSRADAIVLTHADEVDNLPSLRAVIRKYNTAAPIHAARHALLGLRTPDHDASAAPNVSLDDLARRMIFFASGIASPQNLLRQLAAHQVNVKAHRAFDDHHVYSDSDVAALRSAARDSGADAIVVTEKDWVKIARLHDGASGTSPEFLRLDMNVSFLNPDDEQAMLNLARSALRPAPIAPLER